MSISVEMARRILEASKKRARELRSPVSIAIVDAGGHLVLFERMMAPYGWATGNISLAKANTAVMFNQSTDAVAQWGASIPGFASSLAAMTEGKFIMAAGGWPIRVNGTTIGGIGVSGGNAPGRDDEIARAGLAVVESMSPPASVANRQPYYDERAAPPVPAGPAYSEAVAPQAANGDRQPVQDAAQPQRGPIEQDDPYNAYGSHTSTQYIEDRPGDRL